MKNSFFEKAVSLIRRSAEKISDLFSGAADSLDIYRKERKMEKRKEERKRARMKQRLTPEQYQRYLKDEKKKAAVKGMQKAGAAVLCILAVTLAVRGAALGVGYLGGRIHFAISKKQKEEAKPVYEEKDVTIGSTGCMLLHSPFLTSYADENGNYDFSSIYQYIQPYYSRPDFMTCEFEGALAGDDFSGYPLFRSPDAIIENIRDSGVDLQLLATNHTYDGGSEAFARMMRVYEEKGIACTGARGNVSEKPYYVADIQGVSVGFLDYVYETEGENVDLNGIPVSEQDADLINTFDYDHLESFYSELSGMIQDMKADGARFIVVNLHWGEEYQLEESDVQRQIAQKLSDLGVDALIGGHPHCEQPIDVFTGKDGKKMFCIFSVGNALTNQRKELIDEMPTGHTEDGVMVTLKLHQSEDGTVALSDVDLLPTWVYRYIEDEKCRYFILPLDDVSSLEQNTGLTGIQASAGESRERTMEELGPGLEKARQVFSSAASAKTEA